MSVPQRRARSLEDKDRRRQDILLAGHAYLIEVGLEAFTMQQLADRAGLAKGTVYLYFETREAVLLALIEAKLDRWADEMQNAVGKGSLTDTVWLTLLFQTVQLDPLLLPLLTRLDLLIEHNISTAALIAHKKRWHHVMVAHAETAENCLGLSEDEAMEAVVSVGTFLLGVAQVDQGPKIDPGLLPQDVVESIGSYDIYARYLVNGRRILAGIRAGI